MRVDATALRVGEPFTLSCRAALSLALWERHDLLPATERHLGRAPVRLLHFGSYACRNVNHRARAPLNRHARADALGIAGVVLGDGRQIAVVRQSTGDDPEGRFLRDLHRGACRWFEVVLGPDHDAAHADHLHVARGGGRACR